MLAELLDGLSFSETDMKKYEQLSLLDSPDVSKTTFGGAERGRIASQSLKRTIRSSDLLQDALPLGWRIAKLGEIATYINGRAFKPSEWERTGLPIIRIQNLNNSASTFNYTSQTFEAKYKVVNGDLLFAWSASLDAFIWNRGEAWLNQHIFNVLPKKGTDKKYLYFFLRKIVKELYSQTHGSGMVHITKGKFEATEIFLPSLSEQHRIVAKIEELFSEIDKGVELKWAFEGKLTEQWRAQQASLPTGQELLEQIKTEREKKYEEECVQAKLAGKKIPKKPKEVQLLTEMEFLELPELPREWTYTYLLNIGELGRGKSKHRPRNDKLLFGGRYPFIQTGEVKAAHRQLTTYTATYNEYGLQQSKLWPKDTLCITIAANIANVAILGVEACFPDSIVGFIPHSRVSTSLFVYYFIQSVQKRIEAYAPATAQKNINLETLESLTIPYCSLLEQYAIVQEIESRLSVCESVEHAIDEALQQADVLRQSILKRAFEGKLVPQEPAN